MSKLQCSHYRNICTDTLGTTSGTAHFGNHWSTAVLPHHPAVLYCNRLFELCSGYIYIYIYTYKFPNICIRWTDDARHTDLN